MMSKLKVLYICHNHPFVRPGGAEAYALELYEAMRASGEVEPIFLARNGLPMSNARPREGTMFSPVQGKNDSNQYFFHTDLSNFNWFYGTSRNKEVFIKYFREFLLSYEPDIVH